MKIFNATNSLLDLPYGMSRLRVEPKSFSQDFMGNTDFIRTLVTSYNTEEIAILVCGPYELGMCSSVPVSVNYVVQTTDEVVQKFGLKEKTEKKSSEEPKPEPEPEKLVVEEGNSENEVYVGEEQEPTPEPAPAPKKKRTTRKKASE